MSENASKEKGMWGIQWNNSDWAYVGAVAKQIGLSRSEFVRRSTLSAAKAMTLGVSPYSVSGATATPQNTAANQSEPTRAKQGAGQVGGRRSRTRLAPEAINGPNPEDLGRGGPTNEAQPEASRPMGPRS